MPDDPEKEKELFDKIYKIISNPEQPPPTPEASAVSVPVSTVEIHSASVISLLKLLEERRATQSPDQQNGDELEKLIIDHLTGIKPCKDATLESETAEEQENCAVCKFRSLSVSF